MKRDGKQELLENALRNVKSRNSLNSILDRIVESVSRGFARDIIVEEVGRENQFAEELFEFAKSRVSVKRKFSLWNRLWLDSYSASYSTPEYVGNYRSERLAGSKIVDLGSGAGMQSIMFSRSSHVTGLERDRTRTYMARLNALEYGKEIEFINTDIFSYLESGKVDHEAILFSDPLRSRDSNGNVKLTPDIREITSKFAGVTDSFVFDLPPRTPVDLIPSEDEAEYISLSGNLVRLTRYSNPLAKSQSTAVMFPSGRILRGDRRETEFPVGTNQKYISVPDVSIVSSKLEYMLDGFGEFNLLLRDHRRLVLGSTGEPARDFPGPVYMVVERGNIEDIRKKLHVEKPSKLYLRYSLDPENYYGEAGRLNASPGTGEPLYLFHLGDSYSLCSRIT